MTEIEIKDLTFGYNPSKPVITDINPSSGITES